MAIDYNSQQQQQSLLATYRGSLAHLLQQAAVHGGLSFAPVATAQGIAEARANIAQIKANLRALGVVVADAPGELAAPAESASALPPAVPTASQDEIDRQQERLQSERDRLADLLIQEAKLGSAWAPPAVTGGIREARANIKRIKKTLSDWGVNVPNHPDDTR